MKFIPFLSNQRHVAQSLATQSVDVHTSMIMDRGSRLYSVVEVDSNTILSMNEQGQVLDATGSIVDGTRRLVQIHAADAIYAVGENGTLETNPNLKVVQPWTGPPVPAGTGIRFVTLGHLDMSGDHIRYGTSTTDDPLGFTYRDLDMDTTSETHAFQAHGEHRVHETTVQHGTVHLTCPRTDPSVPGELPRLLLPTEDVRPGSKMVVVNETGEDILVGDSTNHALVVARGSNVTPQYEPWANMSTWDQAFTKRVVSQFSFAPDVTYSRWMATTANVTLPTLMQMPSDSIIRVQIQLPLASQSSSMLKYAGNTTADTDNGVRTFLLARPFTGTGNAPASISEVYPEESKVDVGSLWGYILAPDKYIWFKDVPFQSGTMSVKIVEARMESEDGEVSFHAIEDLGTLSTKNIKYHRGVHMPITPQLEINGNILIASWNMNEHTLRDTDTWKHLFAEQQPFKLNDDTIRPNMMIDVQVAWETSNVTFEDGTIKIEFVFTNSGDISDIRTIRLGFTTFTISDTSG